jgi:hypothetical protein
VAIYGLVETGAINLSFAVVWNYGSSLNLPSWVPDWGSEALLETCCDGTCPLCQDIPPHVSVVGGGWVIRIDGLMIDSIKFTGSKKRWSRSTADYSLSKELGKKELQEVIDLLVQRSSATRDLHGDYWRVVVCDLDENGHPAPPGFKEGYGMLRRFLPEYPSFIETE